MKSILSLQKQKSEKNRGAHMTHLQITLIRLNVRLLIFVTNITAALTERYLTLTDWLTAPKGRTP